MADRRFPLHLRNLDGGHNLALNQQKKARPPPLMTNDRRLGLIILQNINRTAGFLSIELDVATPLLVCVFTGSAQAKEKDLSCFENPDLSFCLLKIIY